MHVHKSIPQLREPVEGGQRAMGTGSKKRGQDPSHNFCSCTRKIKPYDLKFCMVPGPVVDEWLEHKLSHIHHPRGSWFESHIDQTVKRKINTSGADLPPS